MALLPTKSKGFFAGFVGDLRRLRTTNPETDPAAAIGAILKGGYPATVRQKYERPENRIADLEQFALLADKYDSLERLVSDLILAGDVYGMDSVASDETRDVLVLSTIHQAKGLEWSHVFIPRVIEESFPHRRALDEPGGEEEERRIFYVGITRAMNELTLSYPLSPPRGARGPIVFTTPSRFLLELDEGLFERGQVESGSGASTGEP
jgi:DNA helicase-2/ATP-dependent DNA helicase PcrA